MKKNRLILTLKKSTPEQKREGVGRQMAAELAAATERGNAYGRQEGGMKRHWYFTTVTRCPICGRMNTYRERRYGRRPKRWQARHAYEVDTQCAAYDVAPW